MIARMWRGKVPKKLKSEYVAYLNKTGLPDQGKIAGKNYEKARYYPEDEKFLLNFAEKAEHYEILYDGAKDSK